ncbi:MAG: chorismate synthase [Bacteriovoracaceae bacterium]
MAGNSFGTLFKITTFGESHGPKIGVVIDGCPAGVKIDTNFIQSEMDKRKPGQSKITTHRKENDTPEIVSGVFEGVSTGAPIAAFIENSDNRSKDYNHLIDRFRPNHADFTYEKKYGIRDHNGGGRTSARETACRVFGGSIAKLILNEQKIKVNAFVSQVGNIKCPKNYQELDLDKTYENIVRCPDETSAKAMISYIEEIKKSGDTIGGIITGVISGCPIGLGEPVFDKLSADLGKAMLSINAVKGFELGNAFEAVHMKGSDYNDIFYSDKASQTIKTKTNNSGGIQGGISNGMDIYFRVMFKPVATILKPQPSVDKNGNSVTVEGKGRHDPCVLPRAVSVVEAMSSLVLVDHFLRARVARI